MNQDWKKYTAAAVVIGLVILTINNLSFFPVLIFALLMLFTFSSKGKNLFDHEKWSKNSKQKDDDISLFSFSKKEEKEKKSTENSVSSSKVLNDIKKHLGEKKTNSPSFLNSLTHKNMNQKNSSPFSPVVIVFGLIGIALFALISDGFVDVPVGRVGVVSDKLAGEVKQETLPVGIHLKVPYFQKVTLIDTRIQELTVAEGAAGTKDPIEAITQDGQKVNIDITVQYVIDKGNAPKIFEKVGLDYETKVITPGVRSVVREVVTGYQSEALFKEESRREMAEKITESLSNKYNEKYVTLSDVLIRNVRFSEKYLDFIEEKQIAQQNIQKQEFEKQAAEVKKEKTIIEAQAEAEALKLKGQALAEYPETIQLKFVDKLAPNVNWGILPDGAVPLIDPKSLQKTNN